MSSPLLIISSDYPRFDPDQLQRYTEEGYQVHYIENADLKLFQSLADDIETNEPYAIIAFGAPALHALKFAASPIAKLTATIAYYPPAYLSPQDRRVEILIHAVPPLPPSLGSGVVVKNYTGEGGDDCKVGFAEMARGSGIYRSTAARIAMARDLEVLRRAMGRGGVSEKGGLGIEDVWEEFVEGLWGVGGAWADDGGIDVKFGFGLGSSGLQDGVADGNAGGNNWTQKKGPGVLEWIRKSIPGSGWKMKLLNRTVGVNRVVDEVLVRFRHVGRMEWILPGLEGTGKEVIVGMVLSGGFIGGRVSSLRVYWDKDDVRRHVEEKFGQ